MRFLRTNTAVIVTVGPFFDKTDGVTIEGSLTITNERITLAADTDAGSAPTLILDNITGATSGTANDLNYITGTDAGLMQLELAAADVNRLGRMFLTITDAANHVPVFHEFMVLPAMIYDAFILGTDTLHADVQQIVGAAVSTSTAQLGVNMVSGSAGAITAAVIATDAIDADAIADNAINAASIAADAITAAKIADGAIDAATFAAGAINAAAIAADAITDAKVASDVTIASVTGAVGSVTGAVGSVTGLTNATIADAVWDEDATGHQTQGTFGQAIGDPGADPTTLWGEVVLNLDTTVSSRSSQSSQDIIHTNVTQIETAADAILIDTAEIGAAGAGLTALATQASVNTIDDFLDTEVAAILAAVDTEVAAIKGVTDNLARSAKTIVQVTVDAASTTTSVITSSLDPAAAVADQFKGRILIFAKDTTTTNLRGQATDITASTSGGVLTVTALTTAPVSGDTAVIV